jgi:thioredoxin 1
MRLFESVHSKNLFSFKNFNIMALVFSDASFEADVLNSDKVTLVDLWAEWCGPCVAMGPIVDELAKDYKDVANIGKLNVDQNEIVPTNYNVRGIPTFLIFKNGELRDKVVGSTTKKALAEKIDALVKETTVKA